MGNRSCEKLSMGHSVLFAFEEAIGKKFYLVHEHLFVPESNGLWIT